MRWLSAMLLVAFTSQCAEKPLQAAEWKVEREGQGQSACVSASNNRRLCFLLKGVDGRTAVHIQFKSSEKIPGLDLKKPFILVLDGQQASSFTVPEEARDIMLIGIMNNVHIRWGGQKETLDLLPKLRAAKQIDLWNGDTLLLSTPTHGLDAALAALL